MPRPTPTAGPNKAYHPESAPATATASSAPACCRQCRSFRITARRGLAPTSCPTTRGCAQPCASRRGRGFPIQVPSRFRIMPGRRADPARIPRKGRAPLGAGPSPSRQEARVALMIRPPAERRAAAWRPQGRTEGARGNPSPEVRNRPNSRPWAPFPDRGRVRANPLETRRYAPNRPIPPGSANFEAPGLARRADSGVLRPTAHRDSAPARACRAGRGLGARSFRIDSGPSLRQSAPIRRFRRPEPRFPARGRPVWPTRTVGRLICDPGAVCVCRSCGFLRASAKRSLFAGVPCRQVTASPDPGGNP